jgi:hypothetical protein
MNPEKEIARWRETINDLKKQSEAAHTRIAELSEAKKPLTLAGHTGDQKAKARLTEFNAEIRVVEQEAVDLAEAITQAGAKLAEAEAEKARRDEVKRLKKVRKIAEQRIELGSTVEAKAEELADLCEQFRRMGFEMGHAGAWPVGDSRWARADGGGRLLLCLQKHIGAIFEDPANPKDPRISQALADMERGALGPFLLSDAGIKKVADTAA